MRSRCGKGQSLIEVIIATTVGILVVTALTFATIFSLRNANFAKNSAQATKLAQEGIEKVRTLRDRDGFTQLWPITFSCSIEVNNCYFYFNAVGTLMGGNALIFETIPPNFKRQFQIEDAGAEQKKVTSIVRWTDFAGDHESELTTILGKL